MPKLPKELTHLNCGANNLTEITNSFYGQYELPKTLKLLWFYGNNFKELPDLHNSLILINHNVMINHNKSYIVVYNLISEKRIKIGRLWLSSFSIKKYAG